MKPTLTFEQLVEQLKKHNIIVNDANFAKLWLETVNYYKLSGYWKQFYVDTTEKCVPAKNFSDIIKIFEFDSKLKPLLMGVICSVELTFRTQLANSFGLHCKPNGYKQINNFNENFIWTQKYFDEINKSINDIFERYGHDPIVIKHKGDDMPIWVAIEFLSFGKTIKLFKISNKKVKNDICLYYGLTFKQLKRCLETINDLRNVCAHFNRIYAKRMKENATVFQILSFIKKMIKHTEIWNDFMINFNKLCETYKEYINLQHLGFIKKENNKN